MTKIWHPVAEDVAAFAKARGFQTKKEVCGVMGGHTFYNWSMLSTDDEVESLYDYLGALNEDRT